MHRQTTSGTSARNRTYAVTAAASLGDTGRPCLSVERGWDCIDDGVLMMTENRVNIKQRLQIMHSLTEFSHYK